MPKKLTDLAIRNEKPRAKKHALAIGRGLTLLVMPDGGKYWRLRYRFGGRARWLSVGKPYPETSLNAAEDEALRLRALIHSGIDPAEVKARERAARVDYAANTFGQAAESWRASAAKLGTRKRRAKPAST